MKWIVPLLFALHGSTLAAQEFQPTIDQLNHRAYRASDGAPGDIIALAQTTDGALWTADLSGGVFRFDGAQFVRYPGPADDPLPSPQIHALLGSPEGGLWLSDRFGGVSFLKAGRVTAYKDVLPGRSKIFQLQYDSDGTLWAAGRGGLARFEAGRWVRMAHGSLGTVRSVAADRHGVLWVQTENRVLTRVGKRDEFRQVAQVETDVRLDGMLAASADGPVWAFFPGQTLIFPDPLDTTKVLRFRGSLNPVMFDRDRNLWAGNGIRLLRWPREQLLPDTLGKTLADLEEQSDPMGLRDEGGPYRLFQDREGNIWTGGKDGVDRFSRSNITPVVPSPCQGVPTTLTRAEVGAFWSECVSKSGSFVLMKIRDSVVVSQTTTDKWFSAGYRAPDGTVWLGGAEGLAHFEGERLVTEALPIEARGNLVQAIVADRQGHLWVSVHPRGVFRVADGKWLEAGGHAQLAKLGWAVSEAIDGDGGLWFGYSNGELSRFEAGTVQLFQATPEHNIGAVQVIYPSGKTVWIGGDRGIARFDGSRFIALLHAPSRHFVGVSGIAVDRSGDLWANSSEGIVRIPRNEIERAIRDPAYPVQFELFDALDGLPGGAVQIVTVPTIVDTANGQLWFELMHGIAYTDLRHPVRNDLAPPVGISSLAADGMQYPNRGADLRLPIRTSRIDVSYSAGSLTVPEHVQFRYKLDGLDRQWQDAKNRREAQYTNLAPGRYTFRVMASNNDGVWNTAGASIDFEIPPAFHQTRWFYTLATLLGITLLFILYRIRLRQVAAQVRGRLEARLAERERISRELHDTLLQGIQGLILRFQAATDRIPANEPARKLMEQSLDQADKLLVESRDKVKDLRPTATEGVDLVQALVSEGEQFAQLHAIDFKVGIEGTLRALHPIVREEGFLIAREALINAFRHSGAKHIEVEVTYDNAALRIRIRDDGGGISQSMLSNGKPGHFGLIGMRERAKKLGGQLEIWSKGDAGTEVDLRIPANVAYVKSRTE